MRKHVTIEDIHEIISQTDAAYIDESKSDDEDLYMVYTVHACEDGTLVQHSEDCDKTFVDHLWFRDYKNVCCNEDFSDVGYCDICYVLEDLDRADFRELCEDLADQINDWLDSLDEDEEEDED